MTFRCRDVVPIAREVTDHFVDTVHANGRKMITQRAQIASRVGEESGIHVTLYGFPFDLQTVARKV